MVDPEAWPLRKVDGPCPWMVTSAEAAEYAKGIIASCHRWSVNNIAKWGLDSLILRPGVTYNGFLVVYHSHVLQYFP